LLLLSLLCDAVRGDNGGGGGDEDVVGIVDSGDVRWRHDALAPAATRWRVPAARTRCNVEQESESIPLTRCRIASLREKWMEICLVF
jgi:hypothetical protein